MFLDVNNQISNQDLEGSSLYFPQHKIKKERRASHSTASGSSMINIHSEPVRTEETKLRKDGSSKSVSRLCHGPSRHRHFLVT